MLRQRSWPWKHPWNHIPTCTAACPDLCLVLHGVAPGFTNDCALIPPNIAPRPTSLLDGSQSSDCPIPAASFKHNPGLCHSLAQQTMALYRRPALKQVPMCHSRINRVTAHHVGAVRP